MLGRDAVLHLIAEDIYIDIRFTNWAQRSGGGFTYVRSTPPPASPPTFAQQPLSITVDAGANAMFSVIVNGSPAPSLQWRRDGSALSGATNATLSLAGVTASDAGMYDVVATNSAGSATSMAAALTVRAAAPPVIAAAPVAMRSRTGTSAYFSVQASGGTLTYQWFKDGTSLPGAISRSLFIGNVQPTDAGGYSVRVSNEAGSVDSPAAQLTVAATGTARLANLSTRARVGTGGDILIPGFVIAGTTAKTLLVRAIGPRLEAFGVEPSRLLEDPTLTVFSAVNGAEPRGTNDDWQSTPNLAELQATQAAVGAFPIAPSTEDSALLVSLPPQPYTAHISGVEEDTGVALFELYDADVANSGSRLVNLSTRAQVGMGADILIPGIVIEGDLALTLLVRGVGPKLADFGVEGTLADPVMTVFRGNTPIASNDNWQKNPNVAALIAATAGASAFSLDSGSADAALLMALNPGAYTVQIAGKNDTTGVALMEIYVIAP
jgi:hypothetical protein